MAKKSDEIIGEITRKLSQLDEQSLLLIKNGADILLARDQMDKRNWKRSQPSVCSERKGA